MFSEVLSQADIEAVMDNGLEKAVGATIAVHFAGKVSAAWANIKKERY